MIGAQMTKIYRHFFPNQFTIGEQKSRASEKKWIFNDNSREFLRTSCGFRVNFKVIISLLFERVSGNYLKSNFHANIFKNSLFIKHICFIFGF